MKNRQADIFFLLLIIELFTITTILILNFKEVAFSDYILYVLTFLIIVISFYSSLVTGLIISALLVFGYGSYMLYQSLFLDKIAVEDSYFWIILFPLSAFISGKLSDSINDAQNKVLKLENQLNDLVTIDEATGLSNAREFYKDLDEEMSRAKRHEFDLAVMLVEIQYLDELMSIYSKYKVRKIFKILSDTIENVTRTEDKRYKIEEGMFAVIMPNTSIQGAEIVKDRLKKELESITVDNENIAKIYRFDIKIGILQYEEKISNSFEFKELVKKELEYDI